MTITRHFVNVEGRQVHYRRAGSGPVVVLRHESPRSSAALVPLIQALAPRFTVVALDTAGYGLSDPLGVEAPSIADYAAQFGPTLDALGIARCAVYGVHTGACIALELAVQYPERVTGLVLEGLALFTPEERQELIEGYTPAFEPRLDGSHLLGYWSFLRDGHLYFPWFKRDLAHRVGLDLSHTARPELSLHEGVMDMLRARPHYSLGYRAAFRYEPEAPLRAATVPVAVVAREADLLGPHLARLPQGLAGVRAERLQGGSEDGLRRVGDLLAELAPSGQAPAPPRPEPLPGRISRTYATTQYGQLHVRRRADVGGRPLVLLHGSPASAQGLEGLIGALAGQRPLVAFDTLGNGDSDKPDPRRHPRFHHPWIGDYAPVVVEALDDLGIGEFDLYGTHTGANIAAEVAILVPDRVANLILDGITLFDDETTDDILANYFIDLTPRWDAAHLLAAWTHTHDSMLWFPWYRRDPEHAFDIPPASVSGLHQSTVDLLRSGVTYSLAYRAAFEWPARERLPLLRTRTLVCAHPQDPLAPFSVEAAALAQNAVGLAPSPVADGSVWLNIGDSFDGAPPGGQAAGAFEETVALYTRFLAGEDVSAS